MTDSENRAASILLPGETIEEDPKKDTSPGIIKVGKKLYVRTDAKKKAKSTESEGPSTVVINLVRSRVLLPDGKILKAGERVLVPTADVLRDSRYRDYIDKGIIRCVEILRTPKQKKKKKEKLDLDFEDDTGGWGDDDDEKSPSMTALEFEKLRSLADRVRRRGNLVSGQRALQKAVRLLCIKYDLDPRTTMVDMETGYFQLNSWQGDDDG